MKDNENQDYNNNAIGNSSGSYASVYDGQDSRCPRQTEGATVAVDGERAVGFRA